MTDIRWCADLSGKFTRRPYYPDGRIDADCERIITTFLRDHRGKVAYPILTEDLQVLIERHTESLDVYADLGGEDFGHTEFARGRRPVVCISRELSTNPAMVNPFRTTLTHEFGHVIFHGFLYEDKFNASRLPFDFGPSSDVLSCHRDKIVGALERDWEEWQAGYACGAFLMPVSAVRELAATLRASKPSPEH